MTGAESTPLLHGLVRLPAGCPSRSMASDRKWPTTLSGGWHHMGTTRMHRDPKQGVVDPDCRVHGLGNLYVAGAAVFPTAGCANPTFTLVAMSLRLSDHLKTRLA